MDGMLWGVCCIAVHGENFKSEMDIICDGQQNKRDVVDVNLPVKYNIHISPESMMIITTNGKSKVLN